MKNVLWLLLVLAMPASAEFSAAYQPSQTNEVVAIATQMQQTQTLEKLTAVLNRFISVPGNVPVVAQSCGGVNAYYAPSRREIVICYELLADHGMKLQRKHGRTLDNARLSHVLAAELTFVLLHEVGHAVFDIHRIPVLGREEDAADAFAAFVLLETNGASMLQEAPIYVPLMKTPWLIKTLNPAAVYGDEHSLSEQRLANVVCWGFGKDPQAFSGAVAAIRLPRHRAERCANEYAKMDRDVRGLLGEKLAFNRPNAVAKASRNDVVPQRSAAVASADVEAILDNHKCGNCHGMSDRKIGPALQTIAARYRGQDAARQLANNIKNGSSGIWGAVPAPPMRNVSDSDAEEMARWILAL